MKLYQGDPDEHRSLKRRRFKPTQHGYPVHRQA